MLLDAAGAPVKAPFNVQARYDEMFGEYRKGQVRIREIQALLGKLSNEGEALMRGMTRLEGAMTVLKEQGARPTAEETAVVEAVEAQEVKPETVQ